VIDKYPAGQVEECHAPNHPEARSRQARVPFSRELWIERDDFTEHPPKGYFRLFLKRLRYGMWQSAPAKALSNIIAVRCQHDRDTRSGTPAP
jgi:glutaminyl-tRNA synthetase